MKRVLILAEGRRADPLSRQLCGEYYKRCSRTFTVEEKLVKDRAALRAALPKQATHIMLDERGEQLTSRQFAQQFRTWMERAPRLAFVIGGADGLGDELRSQADAIISLGPMTFAHRLVRILLAEQLYRAVSINQGSPYHRD